MVSVVGDDFPAEELKAMEKRGVDLSGLEIKHGKKSFFRAGRSHDNMNSRDTLVTELNVLADFNPVLPAAARSAKYIMLGNLTPAIQNDVLNQLDGSQKRIVLETMNFWMDVARDELKKVIAPVDVLTINDEEARQLSGQHFLVKAAAVILDLGPKILIVKKGEHGVLLFQQDEIFFAPALPLAEVYDPTGAGDTFAGGFIGYLTASDDLSPSNIKKSYHRRLCHGFFLRGRFQPQPLKNPYENRHRPSHPEIQAADPF
jgi:sugar/nucleoside kinase (ribokinase family)